VTANIQALNGSFGGQSNTLSGQVTIDGNSASFRNLPLDPNFNQTVFDQSYACTPNLSAPIPPN
jgi:hypothetical protein